MTLRNIEELTRRVELEFDLRKKRRLANALAGKIVEGRRAQGSAAAGAKAGTRAGATNLTVADGDR